MNNETAIAIPVGPGGSSQPASTFLGGKCRGTPKVRERGHDLRALEGVESSLLIR